MSTEQAIDEFEYKKISGDMSSNDDNEFTIYQVMLPTVIINTDGDLVTDKLTDSRREVLVYDDDTDKDIIKRLLTYKFLDHYIASHGIEITRDGDIIYVDDTNSGAPLLELHEIK